jgi:hypothetical protein
LLTTPSTSDALTSKHVSETIAGCAARCSSTV